MDTLRSIYEWPEWETILHVVLVLLAIYVAYYLFTHRAEISATNLILIIIAVALAVIIQQNINSKTGRFPKYFM